LAGVERSDTAIPGRTKAIIENCPTPSTGAYGTLAIVPNGSYELLEPGPSYKPDFGHEKGDLRPQITFHRAMSFENQRVGRVLLEYPDKAAQ